MGLVRTRGGDRPPRHTLSYANVVSTLALVLAVGGGSALAAGSLSGAKNPAHHKPKLTLNGADKSYISAAISDGHVTFATTANSATTATTATNATNATTATNATNATNATAAANATNATTAATATNALSLGGLAASGYTRNDCASVTGQIKGFATISGSPTYPSTFTPVSGAYNCSGQGVQAKRIVAGIYEVQFTGSPVGIAIGSELGSPAGATVGASVVFQQVAAGDFLLYMEDSNNNLSDIQAAVVTP